MLKNLLKNHKLILASGSPRRQQFFKDLELDVTIDVRPVDEVYPASLKGNEITDYLAKLKASTFTNLNENEIVITSDTIVWFQDKALEKTNTPEAAFAMIKSLSNTMHEVITSVCFTSKNFQIVKNNTTKVWFIKLSDSEIKFYINHYKPFDKAGSYGIQEWIGYIGIEKIEGSYFNVMGLPTHLVYKTLQEIVST